MVHPDVVELETQKSRYRRTDFELRGETRREEMVRTDLPCFLNLPHFQLYDAKHLPSLNILRRYL